MPGFFSLAAASSGSDYLVIFANFENAYWQRVDLNGEAIDPRPKRIQHSHRPAHDFHVTWSGSHYLVFFQDIADQVMMMRIGRSGDDTIISMGHQGYVLAAESSGGETAIETRPISQQQVPSTLTVMNPDGTVVRRSMRQASPAGLFRTNRGWRYVQPVNEGSAIIDAETGVKIATIKDRSIGREHVTASPAGGALLFTNDGMSPLVIDAQDWIHAIEGVPGGAAIKVAGHRDGWMAIHIRSTERPKAASVGLDGTLIEQHEIEIPIIAGSIPRLLVSASRSHHLLLTSASLGVQAIEIEDFTLVVRSSLGIGDSVQTGAVIAAGPGTDLVVWRENSSFGWDVRATRVRDGIPLDGVGFHLGTGPGTQAPAVVFDGEAFVIAWSGESGIFISRVGLDGSLSGIHELGTLGTPLALGSRGDGVALLTWRQGGEDRSILGLNGGSLVTRGEPGPLILPIFPAHIKPNKTAQAFDGRHFLLVGSYQQFALFPGDSNFGRTWIRLLNSDGTPSGPTIEINDGYPSEGLAPIPVADGWIVPVLTRGILELTRATPDGIPHHRVPTISGKIMRSSGGLLIWSSEHRGILDDALQAEWFEPLPIGDVEQNSGALNEGSFMLVRSSDRYAVRTVLPHERNADIGITVTRSRESSRRIDVFRIEHRGGDVIPSIRFGVSGGKRERSGSFRTPEVTVDRVVTDTNFIDGKLSGGLIEGPFAPGHSVEILVEWSTAASRDLLVWALPEARDDRAEDNFVVIPALERRRPIQRGGE